MTMKPNYLHRCVICHDYEDLVLIVNEKTIFMFRLYEDSRAYV